jgi:hypothetical protein
MDILRIALEISRTELGDAVRRLNHLEEELAQVRATVRRSWDKVLRVGKMTKQEALTLQATVDEILAQAVEKRSEIGGAVNWADLRCVDVEISLLDDVVTVTVEEASPDASELCRYVAEELARSGYGAIAVRTER